MNQVQCPSCGHSEVSRGIFRVDPATGERLRRPVSLAFALLVSIPLGLVSAAFPMRYGLGTGCGLWVLGLVAALVIPVVVWDQHKAYGKSQRGVEFVCARCGKRWETDLDESGSGVERIPKFVWRLLRWPPRILYALGLGPVYGRFVLLLTTTGRKTGLPRMFPAQYEEVDGLIYVAAARGMKADWFRNILANPVVEVRVKSRRFRGTAEPITDPGQIADFLELRLKRHPRMVGMIMRSAGLPKQPSREQLEAYATERALVVIRPISGSV